MDILIKPRGKNFWVVPQNDSAREYLYNQTGAVPFAWSTQIHEGEFLRLNRKDKDTYKFLDYLMDSGYTITKEN